MKYIYNTDKDIKEMLDVIGVQSFEELIKAIPYDVRFKDDIGIGRPLSEQELLSEVSGLKNKNMICFNGGGVYDHYIPSVVDFLASRSEFYTSYTPYQAEVSQGTLQYLYEFQSMISALSGLGVSNASLYDGASSLAEACSMALNINQRKKVLLSSAINPAYLEVVKTYLSNRSIDVDVLGSVKGYTDIDSFKNRHDLEEVACIAIQSPNYYGLIENWKKWSKKVPKKMIFIAVSDPLSLSVLASPGSCGADIYCGEGQSLGVYMSMGGPFLGLLSSKKDYVRKMPGRIVGKTNDIDGKDAYVLTLQAREQHIRRNKASSNICTNQSLLALRAAIYMSLLGKAGLQKIAKISFSKSQYLANAISEINGYSIPYGNNFIKEFVVDSKRSVDEIIENAKNENISLSKLKNTNKNRFLIAVTEKRTRNEIDQLVSFLKKQ
ncbi:MAG: aminomethyl-transferring glycine dehydrogenase [Candidatus Marinimicrobia bacterium]|nr:aminomethyl-transferring glycine dehydrogenase [Candidatus Neomarinimicrobiota bacterium]